jgi:hypothetical protein
MIQMRRKADSHLAIAVSRVSHTCMILEPEEYVPDDETKEDI